jgi:hypothetical protein
VAEEQGFEVVDKRRVNADGTPREESKGPEAGAPSETSGAESSAGGGTGPTGEAQSLPPITAQELVGLYINQLQEIAWSRMGLTPNPTSGTIERDLTDARLAIDCAADLIGRIEPLLDAGAQRDLRTMLANLRLNFVQQSGKG